MTQQTFKSYLNEQEVKLGLENNTFIKGIIRVNQRNYLQCFVDNPDGAEHSDILILGTPDRNRALNGDLVAVRLKPREFWYIHQSHAANLKLAKRSAAPSTPVEKLDGYVLLTEIADYEALPENLLKKTAEVISILEQRSIRKAVGKLKTITNKNWVIFSPNDSRIPRMRIPANTVPKEFLVRPQDFQHCIYVAKIVHWSENSMLPKGELRQHLGQSGDVQAEIEGLLIMHGIDTRDFAAKALASLPVDATMQPNEWKIDEKEFKYRRDFRQETVFTIDPMTARDLDDALHIKPAKWKGKPCWEVGVHIADVAYFLAMDTELDNWAMRRGTSVYLVHKVIPMLPRILCEELCSLRTAVDRLTFSVVWHMDDEANVLNEWFGRSVIHSCVQLAYEHAQDIIEHPDKAFAIAELPPICKCGQHEEKKIRHVKTAVKDLHKLARKLKAKRMANGALKLDLPKMKFDLDITREVYSGASSGTANMESEESTKIWHPRGVQHEERKDSNFLVEEYMLFANMAVAKHIHKKFPDIALLRGHPAPKPKQLAELVAKCEKLNIPVAGTSSRQIANSLAALEKDPVKRHIVLPAMCQLLMKCMHLAKYFCTGAVAESEFRHYALSVDFYTHFTSPIRRYPDVVVHRLLAASLGYCKKPNYTTKTVQTIAQRANVTKEAAKTVGELSQDVFLGVFVREVGRIETVGIVLEVHNACFDVLLVKYGQIKRVYVKHLRNIVADTSFGRLGAEDGLVALTLHLKDEPVEAVNGDSVMKESNSNGTGVEKNGVVSSESPNVSALSNGGVEGEAAYLGDDEEENEKNVPVIEEKCPADRKQTLHTLSVVRAVLTPVPHSVKYNVTILPTPDSQKLTFSDVANVMETDV